MTPEQTNRLEEIRREHYPLMVSTLVDYLQLHGDPKVVERALHEACEMELARLQFEREHEARKRFERLPVIAKFCEPRPRP